MKALEEVNLPDNLRYAETHEWVRLDGDIAFVGVSDYAQDSMGDITFVEFPQVGDTLQKGEQFGSLESTKAVSELFMPVSGEILAINESLAESPGLVNSDPYGEGWIVQVKPSHIEDMESLAGADAYREMLGGLE
ncbi:glycine cleavage system H protein [Desulfomonile tiedjei DSM 6799]|uniref:Glycine cleavage system H protein n=1 Tax=Desulfomonile tiedjei (strain ATCC 49306 / DSM 6799 / DCB-1) TaxID=706587 RepID=I4C3N3_DESTA|nr:glycine cleavage system protein GcvH [Desulfomonile tiedjei]AFM24174.1 glycine cleavage system H protein [Desulfomonile tiedjei DSM 6799]